MNSPNLLWFQGFCFFQIPDSYRGDSPSPSDVTKRHFIFGPFGLPGSLSSFGYCQTRAAVTVKIIASQCFPENRFRVACGEPLKKSDIKMWRFDGENKPGFAKLTRSVYLVYTRSILAKIYHIDYEPFVTHYRGKKLSVFWLQSLVPISLVTGRLCALAGASDPRLRNASGGR